MSSRLRFRSGPVQLHAVRVEAETVIAPGDLVYLDSGRVKPASEFAWDTDLATTQAAFADVFLGVSHGASAAGETDDVSVDLGPDGVYEFDVAAAEYEIGDLLGPDETDEALSSVRLAGVAAAGRAIARAAEYRAAESDVLRARFASAFHPGASHASGVIG
jgi:hypothetical protein